MEQKKISLDIRSLQEIATAYGLLVSSMEEASEHDVSSPLRKVGAMLTSFVFMLSHELDEKSWKEAVLSAMGACRSRQVSLVSGKTLDFPEWDPSDVPSLSSYPLCDVLFVLFAFNLAAKEKGNPDDYYGPLFSVAGHILDGVKRGYLAEDEEMKTLQKDYIQRFYSALPDPKKGSETLKNQMESLLALYGQFASSAEA